MVKIQDIVLLSFCMSEIPLDFADKWRGSFETLDCEFRDHIPVDCLRREFVVALCNQLGLTSERKHEITHVTSIF